MCLILFAYQQHPDYPLILIANRDEAYARPTDNAHWWKDAEILAGRDLEAGGTWLGVNRNGRLAAVTNVREPSAGNLKVGNLKASGKSRGQLTRDYLSGEISNQDYRQTLEASAADFAGFNLLFGSLESLWFYSNRGHVYRPQAYRPIEAGIYGISNGNFNQAWPKLEDGREALSAALATDLNDALLLEILQNDQPSKDNRLPSTGVSKETERLLSSRFIRSADYGTRASSLMLFSKDGNVRFVEQNYGINGQHLARVEHTFLASAEASRTPSG